MMENQHRKISGYRELSQQEIDLMNEIKALGPAFEALLNKVSAHIAEQRKDESNTPRLTNATPERFAALAKTDMQTALMYLTRAVAQSEFF